MEYFPYAPEMVRINAAEYSMGIDLSEARQIEEHYSIVTGGLLSETPKVKAVLKPYSIGRYPVTNREYFAFVEETGCRPPVHWIAGSYPSNQGDHPVVNVSWEDANQYCAWLSQKTNKTYRLPSEAEWEYAARGNTDFRFPWGNEWDQQRCNTKESNYQHATPVDLFSQIGSSWCGCADMAGNVSEWTKSSFVPYPGNTNTQTKYNPDDRVLRGGSWNHAAEKARCTYRSCETLTLRESWIGFRCACDL
jgi:formylglycine-generating enzyme required for sulfatase activity